MPKRHLQGCALEGPALKCLLNFLSAEAFEQHGVMLHMVTMSTTDSIPEGQLSFSRNSSMVPLAAAVIVRQAVP